MMAVSKPTKAISKLKNCLFYRYHLKALEIILGCCPFEQKFSHYALTFLLNIQILTKFSIAISNLYLISDLPFYFKSKEKAFL
jgi:hypothetical protein